MITSTRAKQIASSWHSGQWSALYQFASTGKFEICNTLAYFKELQTCMQPEYNLYPGKLTGKDARELNQLGRYLTKRANDNQLHIEYTKHSIYGYLIPYLASSVSDKIASRVTPLSYAA